MPAPHPSVQTSVRLWIRRQLHGLRDQWPFMLVLLVCAGGFFAGVIRPQHWLRAVSVMAAGMLLGALLRLVLPPVRAGWLAVRSRSLDCAIYAGLGVLTFTFGVLVHG
ncbi:hypothetical protein SAMN05892883_1404 [Jatrophihabitans sp. GAS493]|uniref:DUF3017 domain-containing protein n=1 Tax=Jatrophihabitans sp. GAS493 TaxID=1907575 RepID=UPI000BBFCEAB|nr:DUF3017 domain-containing protein [Jatrophihabitans sp. GAS493]SOD71944.1 hypothetical protein SAMN05892883_1404 [Jatrophihabitans sp. GAS493]